MDAKPHIDLNSASYRFSRSGASAADKHSSFLLPVLLSTANALA